MSYIGVPPFGNTVRSVTNITATSGQTTFNITGGYQVGYVDVYLNGILLVPGTDFTATDGLTVVLASGAALDDAFMALSYQTLSLTDAYRQSEVDTLLAAKADTSSLATVATSGAYSDLSGTPTLATVATTGAYSDLTGTPTIPSATSDLTNDSGFITSAAIPTTVSSFTNDSGYLTSSTGVTAVNGSTGSVTVQPTLVSGTNIKTINGTSLLGSGNISAGSSTTLGDIGTYQMLVPSTNVSYGENATASGSVLRYGWSPNFATGSASATNNNSSLPFGFFRRRVDINTYDGGGTALSGTWRKIMAGSTYFSYNADPTEYGWAPSIWVRIA